MPENKVTREIITVAGKLRELITISDEKGNVVHKVIQPLMVEFRPKDVLQVMIGAAILAIPVGFTEETWRLGETLPLPNILGFALLSIIFISTFVHYNYYRHNNVRKHKIEFIKRVSSTYVLSFLVVAILMALIQKAPWTTDWLLAFKRTVLVAFPASMSAAIADMLK